MPYKFKIDEQDFIEDPNGMNASRMEVNTHIIITGKSNLGNLKKAVHAAGIEISKVVLSGYASALAVTSDNDNNSKHNRYYWKHHEHPLSKSKYGKRFIF